jgi:hypothetical protein
MDTSPVAQYIHRLATGWTTEGLEFDNLIFLDLETTLDNILYDFVSSDVPW